MTKSNLGDGKKVTSAPKGYEKVGEEGSKTYYKSPKTIKQAKPTSNPSGGEAYEKHLQQMLSTGVTPEQLVEGKYISPTAIEKYRSFYKPDIVYTEPLPTPAATDPNIPLGRGTNIDRKLVPGNNTDFLTYQYPDVNAGYSAATTKYFDPATSNEIDPAKSYTNGKFTPYFIGSTASPGTLKNNVPTESNEPVVNNPINPTKVLNQGFKDGGKVKKLAGYYATGGSVNYNERFQAVNQANAMNNQMAQNQAKQKKGLDPKTAQALGAGVMSVGNQMYQDPNVDPQSQGVNTAVDSTLASTTPWYALAKGASNIGKSQIKRDEYGYATTNFGSAADDLLKPSHEHIQDAYKREGAGGAVKEIFGGAGGIRAASKLFGKDDKTTGFWGGLNKYSGNSALNQEKNKNISEQQKIEADKLAQEKMQKDIATQGRIQNYITARDEGDLNYNDNYYDPVDVQNQQMMADIGQSFKQGGNQARSLNSMFNEGSLGSRLKNVGKAVWGKKNGGAVGYSNGGKITGKGTAKSDSIKANVEPGSFVVPAENAEVAEALRDELLDASDSSANLDQDNGTEVRLSNEEHLFTPEEVEELELNGINVAMLAPDSEHAEEAMRNGGLTPDKATIMLKDGMAHGRKLTPKQMKYFGMIANGHKCGGMVKGYAKGGPVDPKKELAKIEANKKSAAKMRQQKYEVDKKARAAATTAEDIRKAKLEYDRLNKGVEMLSKEYEDILAREADGSKRLIGESDERIEANKVQLLNRLSKLMDDREAVRSTYEPTAPEAKTTPARGIDYMSGRNVDAGQRPAIPSQTGASVEANLSPQTPSTALGKGRGAVRGKSGVKAPVNSLTADYLSPVSMSSIPVGNTQEPELATSIPSQAETNFMAATNGATTIPEQPGGGKKFNFDNILGNAVNYGIPLAQTAIGLNQLKKAGERPVDELSADYSQNLNKAKNNALKAELAAKYGYSGDEISALQMQNNILTSAARGAARNLSGGSAANALAMERAAANDAFGRSLQTQISDKALQRQKQAIAFNEQQQVNSLIQDKQDRLRQHFGDDLTAWHQRTGSASNLAALGMSNLLDGYRADQRLKNFNAQMNQANNFNTTQ